jgi:4-amino-4-deoxy-L-arabinose transferase-like glycosyltransferase
MNPKYHLPLLVALAAVLFLGNLGGYDLWPPDEPRFAQVAREMMESGDYLAPRVNGQPYKEKPPLYFWMVAAVSAPVGDVTELTARLPSALAGIITLLLTYLLARELYGVRIAFWSGMILVTTQRFWWQARFGQLDMVLTAWVMGSLLCFWCWHKKRTGGYLIGFYLCMAAGVLTKGPPAALFPVLTVFAFYWKRKEARKQLHLLTGLSVVLALVAIWLIPARMAISVETTVNTGETITSNLFRQTVGRFFLGVSHANPPWYYLKNLPVDLLPWSFFSPWTLSWVWTRRKEGEETRFLLSWIVPAFLFFSVCVGKRALYLLPLYPAFSIFFARSVLDLMESNETRWRRWIGAAWGVALLLIGAAPFVLLLTEYKDAWRGSLLLLSLCAFLCALHTLHILRRSSASRLMRHMAVHFCLLLGGVAFIVFPLLNSHKSAREFCAPLRALSEAKVDYDLYSIGFSRAEYVYYAEHFHTAIPGELLSIDGMQALDNREQAKLQKRMLHAIQKAVEQVPITSISMVSEKEIDQLAARIKTKLQSSSDHQAYLQEYKVAMTSLLDSLFNVMNGETPAFVMVQETDWRWVLAFHPDARHMAVFENRAVGSRHVLLLANAPGRKVLGNTQDGVGLTLLIPSP